MIKFQNRDRMGYYCLNCGSWVEDGDICNFCGGYGSYSDDVDDDINYGSEKEERYLKKADEYSKLGMHSEAIEYYKKAQSVLNDGFIFIDIAREYETIEDYGNALAYWEKASSRNSVNKDIAIGHADLLFKLERYEEAIEYYKRVLKKPTVDHIPTWQLIGVHRSICRAYDALEDYDNGDKYWDEAESILNSFVEKTMELGDKRFEEKSYSSARLQFLAILKVDPDNEEARRKHDMCLEILRN